MRATQAIDAYNRDSAPTGDEVLARYSHLSKEEIVAIRRKKPRKKRTPKSKKGYDWWKIGDLWPQE